MLVFIEPPVEESGCGAVRLARAKLGDAGHRVQGSRGPGPKLLMIIGDQAEAATVLGMGVPRATSKRRPTTAH
jgi:hypothetical protein